MLKEEKIFGDSKNTFYKASCSSKQSLDGSSTVDDIFVAWGVLVRYWGATTINYQKCFNCYYYCYYYNYYHYLLGSPIINSFIWSLLIKYTLGHDHDHGCGDYGDNGYDRGDDGDDGYDDDGDEDDDE